MLKTTCIVISIGMMRQPCADVLSDCRTGAGLTAARYPGYERQARSITREYHKGFEVIFHNSYAAADGHEVFHIMLEVPSHVYRIRLWLGFFTMHRPTWPIP